jgi:EAL domain-containing protein (putative c-di-GMP-specific phosphodiesterase class I)
MRAKVLPAARDLASSMDLTAAMGQTIDPMLLMQRVTDRTLDLIAVADGVMVGLADDEGVTYVCGAGHRISHLGTRVDLDSSLSGLAVRTGQLQRSDDTSVDPRVDAVACRRLSVASLVCVPLRRSHDTLGVLAVNAKRARAFTDADVALLTRLAEFVSAVIGSACDLDRVHKHLLDVAPLTEASSTAIDAPTSNDAASRYVMSVLSPDTVARIDCGQRLRGILRDPQVLSMVFQPIIDVVNDEVVAVEALARFDVTPYRSPEVWFSEAHENGCGVELELLAVNRALAELPMLPDGVALSINAGPKTVTAPGFHEAILGVPAQRVIVELTEHNAIDDYPGLVDSLQTIRQRGTCISIDDTGSGYSSLAHILKLAPDFIKLDRDLVSGIDVDPVRRALAACLVAFAAETGAQIVAEGVETEDELVVLRQLGLRYAQGYYLGRPASLETLAIAQRQPASLTAPGCS